MKNNNIWMPYKEYQLYKEMIEKSAQKTIEKMAYFCWNNYSYEGWDKYLTEQKLKKLTK